MLNLSVFLRECAQGTFHFFKNCVDALVSMMAKVSNCIQSGMGFKLFSTEKKCTAPVKSFCVFPESKKRPSFSDERLSTQYSFDDGNPCIGEKS